MAIHTENCLCETPLLGVNLPIHSFNVVKENFRNHLCETTQIGIDFIIHIFVLTSPFTTSPWLKKILKIASVKPLRLALI